MTPTTRNRGRPKTVREPTPESQRPYVPASTRGVQSKRPPAAKSRSKLKTYSKSKSRKPQQTITQMPLLHQLYHPELYHTGLEYEEPQQEVNVENEPLALRSPKRRKISETQSSNGDSKKDTPVNASTASYPIMINHGRSGGSSPLKDIQAMPPPTTTPQRPIRREIPSSQSPFDTPLSALSRRSSQRDTSRSPLTERSINLQMPIAVTPKVPAHLNRREVADSMDTEDEDQDEDENPLLEPQIYQSTVQEKGRLNQRTDRVDSHISHIQVKTSFQEDGGTKEARPSSSTSPPTTRSLEESDAAPTKQVNPLPQQRHHHPPHSTSSNPGVTDQSNLMAEPPPESIPSSLTPQEPDIDLLAARCLPNLAVETDSQFEAGWHTYHPTMNPPPPPPSSTGKGNNNQPSSSQLQYIPSSQPILASPSPPPAPPHTSSNNDGKETAPTHPLPSHLPPPPASPPAVPASQATTTASPTQPQHSQSQHSQSHHQQDDEGPHILVPSSPCRPSFSSPSVGANNNNDDDGGGGSPEKDEEYAERRMRASQLLLPASFLKDSWFVGPDEIEDAGVGEEIGEGEWIEEEEDE